jgi:hypothetical protein
MPAAIGIEHHAPFSFRVKTRHHHAEPEHFAFAVDFELGVFFLRIGREQLDPFGARLAAIQNMARAVDDDDRLVLEQGLQGNFICRARRRGGECQQADQQGFDNQSAGFHISQSHG